MAAAMTSNELTIMGGQLGEDGLLILQRICTVIDSVGGDGSDTTTDSITPPSGTLTLAGTVRVVDAGMQLSATADTIYQISLSLGNAVSSLTTLAATAELKVHADSTTQYTLLAEATSLTETVLCATGEYSKVLTANLADAYSITNGSADLWRWQTTTGAIAGVLTAALVSTPPANQTIANDATITLPVGVNKIVDNSGNVTGIIMTAGIADGQIVNLINAGSGSVTFATAATSNVADGTSAVIATLRAAVLVWDSGASRWFRTG